MPVNNKAIGRNIRNARKAQGMTQESWQSAWAYPLPI